MSKTRAFVMIPHRRFSKAYIHPKEIADVVCNRKRESTEEYLVKWQGEYPPHRQPYSWHPIWELCGDDNFENSALVLVQRYLQNRSVQMRQKINGDALGSSRKRKLPSDSEASSPGLSPFLLLKDGDESSLASSIQDSASEVSSAGAGARGAQESDRDNLNCKVVVQHDVISAQYTDDGIDTGDLPSSAMLAQAARHTVFQALLKIRVEFAAKLKDAAEGHPPLDLVNTVDRLSPSLGFQFIDGYVYGKDVPIPDRTSFEGCPKPCRPNMGGDCGCEYTKWCECLEYARVVEASLDEEGKKDYQERIEAGSSTRGLPKQFPYKKGTGFLVPFYLNSRYPIYECNDNCNCGPNCKTRVVQKGRQVGLEIFKTKNRGWGLRCQQALQQGQFIDLYKGEVLTLEEAEKRRNQADNKTEKDSYFYALDKFKEECREYNRMRGMSEDDAVYEVDGEFKGGPTRFMNHSCDPNCRQYVICYNKSDPYQYHIAFFAIRPIPKGEELTFDYLDRDEGESEQDQDEADGEKTQCKCGASNCRKWLWI